MIIRSLDHTTIRLYGHGLTRGRPWVDPGSTPGRSHGPPSHFCKGRPGSTQGSTLVDSGSTLGRHAVDPGSTQGRPESGDVRFRIRQHLINTFNMRNTANTVFPHFPASANTLNGILLHTPTARAHPAVGKTFTPPDTPSHIRQVRAGWCGILPYLHVYRRLMHCQFSPSLRIRRLFTISWVNLNTSSWPGSPGQ